MLLLHHQHLKHVTLVQTTGPDGTIVSTSNEGCTPTTTAPVSDTCGSGVDNNATDTTNVACLRGL